MPIKVVCQCGQQFAAKDEMAGKRVKCPKCGQPLTIGAPQQAQPQQPPAQPQQPQAPATPAMSGGLGDLLDEIGSPAQASGPQCPACGAEVQPGAIICVECGFNSQTGERIQSAVQAQQQQAEMSDAERLIQKAEAEIAASPMQGAKYDYGGEGVKTYMVALGLIVGVAIALVIIGVFIVHANTYVFAKNDDGTFNPERIKQFGIQVVAGLILLYVWVDVIGLAFVESPVQGLIALATCAYSTIYMIFRTRKLPRAVIAYLIGVDLTMISRRTILITEYEAFAGNVTLFIVGLIAWDIWIYSVAWLTGTAYDEGKIGHLVPCIISTWFSILLLIPFLFQWWFIMPGFVILVYPFVYGFLNVKTCLVMTIVGIVSALTFIVFSILYALM